MLLIAIPLYLALTVSLYAGAAKAAAFLLGRVALKWRHAAGFGTMAAALFLLGWLLHLGIMLILLCGGLLPLLFGTYLFHARAYAASGERISFGRALALSAVALGLVFVFQVMLAAGVMTIDGPAKWGGG